LDIVSNTIEGLEKVDNSGSVTKSKKKLISPVQKEYRSILDIVFCKLRDEILSGKLKPGDSLNTLQLSQRLGASRTPIREALNRLASVGLVEYITHRGAFVKKLSVAEVIELYHIRAALEGIAARLSVGKFTKETKDKLIELCDIMDSCLACGDFKKMLDINFQFHSIINNTYDSPRLQSLILQYYQLSRNYRALGLELPGRIREICREHRNIAEALCKNDKNNAEKYMREHHFNTARRIASSFGSKAAI
jgi:DNA-binding GntR family transcriptional regulator